MALSPRTRSTWTVETVLAALTVALSFTTLLTWDSLSDDASAFLLPLFWIAVLVAMLGLGLRALRVPWPLVPLVQVVTVGLVLHQRWVPEAAFGGWLPTPDSLARVVRVLEDAVEVSGQYAAPMPPEAVAFPPIMILAGAAVVLLVDLCALTLRRVPLAGLPLLAAFTAPVSITAGVPWLLFAIGAMWFVLLLAADQVARLGAWGRNLTGSDSTFFDDQPHEIRLSTTWPVATRLGLVGVGLAVLAPLVLPSGLAVLSGSGPGFGPGGTGVTIDNPMVDIRRNLDQGPERPMVSVVTDDPQPEYLRLTVLDVYDGERWLPSDRDLPPANRAEGTLPAPPGLDPDTPRDTYRSAVRILDGFDSLWLPMPYPTREIEVAGDWRYDLRTLDLVDFTGEGTQEGQEYSLVADVVRPQPRRLVVAPFSPPGIAADGTDLPEEVPDWLGELAQEVTDGSTSDFESAAMLQQWFRQDGGFEYSVEPGQGNTIEQLDTFLRDTVNGRIGYCEQFATAMALMARSLGIPARVAVGFYRPDPIGEDSWVYTNRDMHAWPELYFAEAGWTVFEPTPGAQIEEAPGYTQGQIPTPQEVETPTTAPSADAPAPLDRPTVDPGAVPGAVTVESGTSPLWWVAAATVLLVQVVWVPRMLRSRQRRRRTGAADPQEWAGGAWSEVRATALDLGLGWDDGATLRRRARDLVGSFGVEARRREAETPGGTVEGAAGGPGPMRALERLVLLVERARYSQDGLSAADADEGRRLVGIVTDALEEAARPRARWRATWLPASLWGRRRERRLTGMDGRRGTGPASGEGSGDGSVRADRLDRVAL